MKVITKYKTTEIIKLTQLSRALIVCYDRKEAHRVIKQAEKMDININLPITFKEFLEGRYSARFLDLIFIDNIDICLNSISKVNVEAVTLRNEDDNDYCEKNFYKGQEEAYKEMKKYLEIITENKKG